MKSDKVYKKLLALSPMTPLNGGHWSVQWEVPGYGYVYYSATSGMYCDNRKYSERSTAEAVLRSLDTVKSRLNDI